MGADRKVALAGREAGAGMQLGRGTESGLATAFFGHEVSPVEGWVQENFAGALVHPHNGFPGGETAKEVFGGATHLKFDACHPSDDAITVDYNFLSFFEIDDFDWAFRGHDNFSVPGDLCLQVDEAFAGP